MIAAGFEFIRVKELAVKSWRERETFSGGVNISARERNLARLAETQRVYVDTANQRIYGAPDIIGNLELQLATQCPHDTTPVKDADDLIDDLYAEQSDLRKDHPRYADFYAELAARIEAAEVKRAAEMAEYFKRRNPLPSSAELDELFARVDLALGKTAQ